MTSIHNNETVKNGDALRQLASFFLNDDTKGVKQEVKPLQDTKLVENALPTSVMLQPFVVRQPAVLQAHEASHTTPRNYGKISFNRKKQCFELHILDESGVRMNGLYFGQYSTVPLTQECDLQLGPYISLTFSPPTANDMKLQSPTRSASYSQLPVIPVVEEEQEIVPQESPKKRKRTEETEEDDENRSFVTLEDPERDLQEHPFETYQEMITECLRAQTNHTCTLQGIYQWMSETYAVFASVKRDWHASVRTYLCKSTRFYRVPGQYKPAVYALKQEYINKDDANRRKKRRRLSTSTTDADPEQ